MKNSVNSLMAVLFVFGGLLTSHSQTEEQRREITKNYDQVALKKMKVEFEAKFKANYERALEMAKQKGWPLTIDKKDGGGSELLGVTPDGFPLYYTTSNKGSAITSRTNKIQPGGGLGLSLTGNGMYVGVWEKTRPYMAHLDLVGRMEEGDFESEEGFHATHVTGTIISSGKNNVNGRGLAYEAIASSYNWANDLSEMTDFASSGYLVSNHSYGLIADNVPTWYFGAYLGESRDLDQVLYEAPYYQAVVAAGNDRGEGFNASKNGYDLLTKYTTSKNAVVVAAVYEVPVYVDEFSVEMSDFSSWGPTDDNRVKPDISTKGVDVVSTVPPLTPTSPNKAPYGTSDGTSMACPAITANLLLLQEHYNNLFDKYMLSATLRGLMIHTASETGNYPGPDPEYGWGLMNAEKAAQTISDSKDEKAIISELKLTSGIPYTLFVKANGNEPIVATINWTDRPGSINTGDVDKKTPVLVSNLDMTITKDTEVFYPWKLGSTYTSPAEKADNNVDNVEKIEIENPVAGGLYKITIKNDGALIGGSQNFSLILTGADDNLSVKEVAFKTFDLWPNPVKDELNIAIQSELSDDVYVTIYDILGKRVVNKKLDYENELFKSKINAEFLNPGVYFVNVKQGDKYSVRKIIKE
ncbi:MAG TPA: S8/S53 family peptidase [Flavobacterium sp.]|nr:S8/S53 family peptidase [Flavobacterium sp.]